MSLKFTQLRASCDTVNLKQIRNFVSGKLGDLDVNGNTAEMIVLAVDEVCANVMIHSNDCNTNQELELCLSSDNGQLLIEIFDNGLAFNHHTYKEPCLKEVVKQRKKGGIGMMLVRRIVDSIEYDRVGSRNVCRLKKRL